MVLKNIAQRLTNLSISTLDNLIKSDNLKQTFPYVEISTRMFLCLMNTNCTENRLFSQLKTINNELRILQERLICQICV